MFTKIRTVVAPKGEENWDLTEKGHKETFAGDISVLYLDGHWVR